MMTGTILVGITVWAALGVGLDFPAIWRNWPNAAGTHLRSAQPDYLFFPQTVGPIRQTLYMAVIGTAVGPVISLPLSFLASQVANNSPSLMYFVRRCNNINHAIPDLLYAAIFVAVIGTGALSGIFALILMNIGRVKTHVRHIEGKPDY